MMKRILLFSFFSLLALSLKAQQKSPTEAVTYTVAQDGSGDFKTIQEGVNAFRDHMQVRVTLIVKKGTYTEKLVIPSWKPNIHINLTVEILIK